MKQKNRLSEKNNIFTSAFNRSGQMIVEMVLILSIFMFAVTFLSRQFEDIEPFDAFVTGPWKTIAGMIESGTWKEITDARIDHPNHFERMYSGQGDTPP